MTNMAHHLAHGLIRGLRIFEMEGNRFKGLINHK